MSPSSSSSARPRRHRQRSWAAVAALAKRAGQRPPATSAIASNGRQLSASRLMMPSGISGSRRRDALGVVRGPARGLAGQHVEMVSAVEAERRDPLLPQPPLQFDHHGAVVQRVGQRPDQRDDDRRIGRERADSKSSPTVRSTVPPLRLPFEHAAQLVVVVQERIGLVDQQRRLLALDDAEDRGRRDVRVGNGRGTKRPSTSSNMVLPHPFVGERTPSRGEITKQSISQSMHDPQRRHVARVFGHDDVPAGSLLAIASSSAAPFNRLGPRLGLRKRDRVALLAVVVAIEPKRARARPSPGGRGSKPRNAEPLGGGLALRARIRGTAASRAARSPHRRRWCHQRRFSSSRSAAAA